jgi:ElaB/YqjD/DUF883 family membrane-anchored ribosome-binding protein
MVNHKNNNYMTIQEAIVFFENIKDSSNNNYRIKIFKNFLYILESLQKREFSEKERLSIENKLESLDLESNKDADKKELNKILKSLTDYLKEEHSLVRKGHYTNIGVTMGSAFGVVLGVLIKERMERSIGIALGVVIGVTIGIVAGKILDAKVKTEGKEL